MIKNICVREEYINNEGESKVAWNIIGKLIETNDKQYIKIFHMPGVLASVFENKNKEHKAIKDQPMEDDF